jgi:hypothetical protein
VWSGNNLWRCDEPLAAKDSKTNQLIASAAEISLILGVSQSRIRQLYLEDVLVRISHGKYDLPASIQSYLNYVLEKEKPEEELNKTEEEAKWTRARRMKAEMELQIMRGELHRSGDVKRVMNNMLGSFRSRILAIPPKTAGQLQGKTDFNAIKNILKDAVHEALAELSNYDPYVFYAESKDKLSLDDEDLKLLGEEQVEKEPVGNARNKEKK